MSDELWVSDYCTIQLEPQKVNGIYEISFYSFCNFISLKANELFYIEYPSIRASYKMQKIGPRPNDLLTQTEHRYNPDRQGMDPRPIKLFYYEIGGWRFQLKRMNKKIFYILRKNTSFLKIIAQIHIWCFL